MIIRSFVADTMAAALKDVRTQMGGEAVVLKTKQLTSGDSMGRFEVTACLDNPSAAQASRALPDKATPTSQPVNRVSEALVEGKKAATNTDATSALTKPTAPTASTASAPAELLDRMSLIESHLERLVAANDLVSCGLTSDLSAISDAARKLRDADMPESIIRSFLTSLRSALTGAEISHSVIRSALQDRLSLAIGGGIELKPGDRVLVMGPAGCGKTSIIGKLAHSLVTTRHIPVRLQTLDSIKVGALDEIQSLGDVLGVEVSDPGTVMDLAEAARSEADKDKVVLIDSGALPTGEEKLREFQNAVEAISASHRLAVYSATTRSLDIQRQANAMAAFKPTHSVLTMLDMTNCWGAVFGAIDITNTRLALIADSPSGAGSLRTASVDLFMDALLGKETTGEVNHG